MQKFPVLLIVVTWCTLVCGSLLGSENASPNIIWIMVDDMGYGDAGCYGQKEIQTPSIDQLASQGMLFTDCYAGAPVCAPSRSVLMTGLHTGHTRVRGNFGARGGVVGLGGGMGRVPLRENDLTIAQILQSRGYQTAHIGKWGLGEPNTSGEPNQKGFDFFFGFYNQRRAHNHYPEFLWLNKTRFDLPGNAQGKKYGSQYAHDLFSSFAATFVRRAAGSPFFLYLSYTVPHSGFEVPDFGIYQDKPWTLQQKGYAAMITRADKHIGNLMQLLDKLDLVSDTIVFFCSDNGAADRYEGLFDSSGILKGRKRDMYEGGIRTPMIVSWPGKIPAGTRNSTPWYFADFLPTAASLAGADIPQGLDGVDISSLFLTPDRKPGPAISDRYLYWEFFERGFKQAVRWKDWKAIRPTPGGPIQLFNLDEDPGEKSNIADQHAMVVERFENYLRTCRIPSEEFPSPLD